MGTLKAQLKLDSTDFMSDPLNIDTGVVNITFNGDEQAAGRYTCNNSAAEKLPVGEFDTAGDKKAYIYFKNVSTNAGENINVKVNNSGAAGDTFLSLSISEFAFLPYAQQSFVWIQATSGSPVLEYGVFEDGV